MYHAIKQEQPFQGCNWKTAIPYNHGVFDACIFALLSLNTLPMYTSAWFGTCACNYKHLNHIHCCVIYRTTDHLGSGQFGSVDKGVWMSPEGEVRVAVKQLKEGTSEADRVKFLKEAAIMGQFQHPNVIKLHGVVTMAEPVCFCNCC